MQESQMLRQQNYQLKNQISQLKNAFDLNRDILKILSQTSKSIQPKNQIFYQIINRLTAINNQVMINAAQLIQQKNKFKGEVINLQRQNDLLKERISQIIQKQLQQHKNHKLKELHFYLQNKIISKQKQNKALEEQLFIKQHQILRLKKDLDFFQHQNNKKSLIPTIDKFNNKILSNELSVPLKSVPRKYSFTKEQRSEQKIAKLQNKIKVFEGHIEQIEYRLMLFIKLYDIQDSLAVKKQQKNIKKCLEEEYKSQMIELRLLKFATNNLLKNQKNQHQQTVFTTLQTTKRNRIGNNKLTNKGKCRNKSQELESKIKDQK